MQVIAQVLVLFHTSCCDQTQNDCVIPAKTIVGVYLERTDLEAEPLSALSLRKTPGDRSQAVCVNSMPTFFLFILSACVCVRLPGLIRCLPPQRPRYAFLLRTPHQGTKRSFDTQQTGGTGTSSNPSGFTNFQTVLFIFLTQSKVKIHVGVLGWLSPLFLRQRSIQPDNQPEGTDPL